MGHPACCGGWDKDFPGVGEAPEEEEGHKAGEDGGDMVGDPEEGVGPCIDGVHGPPFRVAVKGGLQESLADGGKEVGARDE